MTPPGGVEHGAPVAGGDEIQLRGLRAIGVHGSLPEEQTRAQPFEVDLDVQLDLSRPGESDDLDDTVDYAALCEATVRVVSTERFRLMEALAERIASVVGADDRVRGVRVHVRKVRPPVAVDLRSVGVQITRTFSA